MASKSGPGAISLLHVIDRTTAERRLAFHLENEEGVPLAHLEMTRAEAVNFHKLLRESIQSVWPNTNLDR